jgi:hypothetical protein
MLGEGPPPFAPGEKARFLKLNEHQKNMYREFRAANPVSRPQNGFQANSFAACQDHEVALENGGQGDFTRRAVPLLRNGFRQLSHSEFQRQVMAAFGATPRQNPKLDCDPGRQGDLLLMAKGNTTPAPGSSNNHKSVIDAVQAGLRRIIDDVEGLR